MGRRGQLTLDALRNTHVEGVLHSGVLMVPTNWITAILRGRRATLL
jgi:hypothetical protein